jgi:hypothetical protein
MRDAARRKKDMLRLRRLHLFIQIVLLVWLPACQPTNTPLKPAAEYPAEIALQWFDLQLRLIAETPGFTPPVAARALAYSGVALYESVVGGMPEHQSLSGRLNALTSLPPPQAGQAFHWAAVVNSAQAAILRRLYPTMTPENRAAVDALEQKFDQLYQAEVSQAVFARSTEYGRALAEAIFEWSKFDGGHEGYARNFPESFAPPNGPGKWVPTLPGYQPIPLQPTWGDNRPFVLKSGATCAPPPPTEYSEDAGSQFYAEAREVYDTVRHLTPEQREIALFWADDPGQTATPSGHSIAIATQVLRTESASLALAAETYLKVGLAAADAFIGCWQAKYTYNLVRPISYIQAVIDPTWNHPDPTDPVLTPPFPEYPSGHSVQSGAVAVVLTALFGEGYAFTDTTHVERGLKARTFDSFFTAAEEAAISRLYGGIHFRPAIEAGLAQGRCIGERINALELRKPAER